MVKLRDLWLADDAPAPAAAAAPMLPQLLLLLLPLVLP